MEPPPHRRYPEISLEHSRERTLEFLDGDDDLSWDICPESQLVTYMGHLKITDGPPDAPTRVTFEHSTLHLRLPFHWMWTPPPPPSSDSSSEPPPSYHPGPSTEASEVPARRVGGARIRTTARKRVGFHGRPRDVAPAAAAAAVVTISPILVVAVPASSAPVAVVPAVPSIAAAVPAVSAPTVLTPAVQAPARRPVPPLYIRRALARARARARTFRQADRVSDSSSSALPSGGGGDWRIDGMDDDIMIDVRASVSSPSESDSCESDPEETSPASVL